MQWLSSEELKKFKSVGENVFISRGCFILGFSNIEIGSNVRIDTFCIILATTGYLKIGSHVHIAARTTILCAGGVTLDDFTNISFNCVLLSATDGFDGESLIGPMVPEATRSVYRKEIVLKRGSVIATNCVVCPGTVFEQGAALGASSLTKKNQVLEVNWIYLGSPAKKVLKRSNRHVELANSILPQA